MSAKIHRCLRVIVIAGLIFSDKGTGQLKFRAGPRSFFLLSPCVSGGIVPKALIAFINEV